MTRDNGDAYLFHFAKATTMKKHAVFREMMYGTPDALVESVVARLSTEEQLFRSPLSVCDIGAGTGERTLAILKSLEKKGARIDLLSLIEPSFGGLDAILHNNDLMAYRPHIIPFRLQYAVESIPDEQHDLVLSIHSIYTFDSEEARRLFASRAAGGLAYVVANDETSVLARMKRVIDGAGERYEVNQFIQDASDEAQSFQSFPLQFPWSVPIERKEGAVAAVMAILNLGNKPLSDAQQASLDTIVTEHTAPDGAFGWTEKETLVRINGV